MCEKIFFGANPKILSSKQVFADRVPVLRFRSSLTNLTVTVASADSPIVGGLFCLATEDTTDDGLPHTLEHLIFQGSK